MQLSVQLPDAIAKNFLQTVPENQRSQVLSDLLSSYLQNMADSQNIANTPQHTTTDVALADEQQRRQKRQALLDNLPPMTKKFAGIIENVSDAEIDNLSPITKKYSKTFGENKEVLSDIALEEARAEYLLNK